VSALNLPAVWTEQPQDPVEPDWSNSLTRGLIFLMLPAFNRDLSGVTPIPFTDKGTAGNGVGSSLHMDRVGNDYAFQRAGQLVGALANSTLISVFSLGDLPVDYSEYPIYGEGVSGDANAFRLTVIANNPPVSQIYIKGDAGGDLPLYTNIALTRGPQFIGYTRNPGQAQGYSQVETSSYGGGASNSFTNAGNSIRIGGAAGKGSYQGAIHLIAAWNRDLSPTEMRSLRENPWQLFQPTSRRLIVSASGGANTAVNPGVGSVAITGYAPTLTKSASILPSAGLVTLTGYAPSVSQFLVIAPSAGSIALTGYGPTIFQLVNVAPTAGSMAFAGFAPTLTQPVGLAPSNGPMTIAGYAPALTQLSGVIAGSGSLALAGYAPTLAQPHAVNAAIGSLSVAGQTPSIIQTVNQSVSAGPAQIIVSGLAPTLAQSSNAVVRPGAGVVGLAGWSPTVNVAPQFRPAGDHWQVDPRGAGWLVDARSTHCTVEPR
jgi:hypothetical protein